jgi:hypothetical protein
MEMSSPLAAMHPPAAMPAPWGYRRDLPPSKPLFGVHNLGQKSFNFRDMSMKKGGMDGSYFAHQPMRGSSPTASLAADMSSNLHVDQRYGPPLHGMHLSIVRPANMPLLAPSWPPLAARYLRRLCSRKATPRVSQAVLCLALVHILNPAAAEGVTPPPVRWEGVTTPPIPDSSPNFVPDSMDISPLPHKAPFNSYLTAPSPSPADTMSNNDDDMCSPRELTANGQDINRPSSAAEYVHLPADWL